MCAYYQIIQSMLLLTFSLLLCRNYHKTLISFLSRQITQHTAKTLFPLIGLFKQSQTRDQNEVNSTTKI